MTLTMRQYLYLKLIGKIVMSNFKLKENKDYEEKASGRVVTITDVRGEDGTFIGYRWNDAPEVRWGTADEFRRDFIPLSKITLEERCNVLGSAIAEINTIVQSAHKSPSGSPMCVIETIIEKCIQELRTDV